MPLTLRVAFFKWGINIALRKDNIKLINDVKSLGFTVGQLARRLNASTAEFVTSPASLIYRPSIPDSVVSGLRRIRRGETDVFRVSPKATKAGRKARKKSKLRPKRFTRYQATFRCNIGYSDDPNTKHTFMFVRDGRTKNVRERAKRLHNEIYTTHENPVLLSVGKRWQYIWALTLRPLLL